ncbi:MAG: hypothetical protein JNK05_38075 [Myxococcales bacterium]|nr:hypothetical protein [Myxococcales bacterium]
MATSRRHVRGLVSAPWIVLCGACSTGGNVAPDSARDVADAAVEAATDSAIDAPLDAPSDVPFDAPSDVPFDTPSVEDTQDVP